MVELSFVVMFAVAAQSAAPAPVETPAEADTPSPPSADVVSGDEDLFELESEIVTSASRAAEPIRTAPASVTVIGERELRAFSFVHVADALLGVRGLYQTDDRLYTSLGIRGFNRFGDYGNRSQVQVDGHVMNDDWIFSSYIGNDQYSDIEHVDSIEVVRGPGSALYGTGAFFGVVNLKTPRRAPDYSARVRGGVIDQSTFRLHLDGGHQFGTPGDASAPGFWLSLGAASLPGRDYRSSEHVGTPWAPDGRARGVDAFSTASLVGKAWWGDATLSFSGHRRDRRVPTGHFDTTFADRRNMSSDERGFVELRYEPALTDTLQLLTRAYVDHQKYEGHYASTVPEAFLSAESFEGNWGGLEARLLWTPLANLRATGGAQYELHPLNRWLGEDTPGAEPYIDQSSVFHYVSAYAVADWTPLPWLVVSGGARFDGWLMGSGNAYGVDSGAPPGFLWSLNPRAALIWLPTDDDTLKLMAGRSYRIPSVYELTYSAAGLDFTGGPTLESESIYTGELEYRRRLGEHTVLIASGFGNAVLDLIAYRAPPDVAPELEGFDNEAAPVFTLGSELEVRHEVVQGLFVAGQVSLQSTKLGEPFTGGAVPNSPERLASLKVIFPLHADELSLATRFVIDDGRLDRELRPVPPFFTWDAMLTGRFRALPVGFTVGLENILDVKNVHPVTDDVREAVLPQEGRALRAEVSAWF